MPLTGNDHTLNINPRLTHHASINEIYRGILKLKAVFSCFKLDLRGLTLFNHIEESKLNTDSHPSGKTQESIIFSPILFVVVCFHIQVVAVFKPS